MFTFMHADDVTVFVLDIGFVLVCVEVLTLGFCVESKYIDFIRILVSADHYRLGWCGRWFVSEDRRWNCS